MVIEPLLKQLFSTFRLNNIHIGAYFSSFNDHQ